MKEAKEESLGEQGKGHVSVAWATPYPNPNPIHEKRTLTLLVGLRINYPQHRPPLLYIHPSLHLHTTRNPQALLLLIHIIFSLFISFSPLSPLITSSTTILHTPYSTQSINSFITATAGGGGLIGGADEIETSAMKNCVMLLSAAEASAAQPAGKDDVSEWKYDCKDCGKKFRTFQGLGGHRASHMKLKSATHDGGGGGGDGNSPVVTKSHACSVCGLEFATGQALGGHMRRHRPLVVPGGGSGNNSSVVTDEVSDGNNDKKRKNDGVLDGEDEVVKTAAGSSKRLCLELCLSFTYWYDRQELLEKNQEIEEGEIVEEIKQEKQKEKEEEYDFLKL